MHLGCPNACPFPAGRFGHLTEELRASFPDGATPMVHGPSSRDWGGGGESK